MHSPYEDIRRRIPEEPKWWDEQGCPRYDPFHPKDCADPYATEAVLLRVRCAACDAEFDAVVTRHVTSKFDEKLDRHVATSFPLRDAILEDSIHYGDPPRHAGEDGMCIGSTMQSHSLVVLGFWEKIQKPYEKTKKPGMVETSGAKGWVRDAEYDGIVIDRLD